MQKQEENQRHTVLIVDDEEAMCELLQESLQDQYDVSITTTGRGACELIDHRQFDLYVIDLKLPDMSGVEVLTHAKKKDEYCEVIIVTGYGSVDSASWAVNHGASSYLIKPITLDDFYRQLERCIANRVFHLRSIRSLTRSQGFSPEVRTHINDITSLYTLSRKLLFSLDLPELIQIILNDVNKRMDTSLSILCIWFLNFSELFAMPRGAALTKEELLTLLQQREKEIFTDVAREEVIQEDTSVTIFDPEEPVAGKKRDGAVLSLPLTTGGRDLGSLILFRDTPVTPHSHEYYFLHVYTSLISSIMQHAYTDIYTQLQAKTDTLTGIGNYRLFREALIREIARADRREDGFSLLIIDIDDFKKINDTYGHPVGNDVIRDLCGRIQKIMRKSDLFARYGGEEFVIILPDTGREGAQVFAERARTSIADRPFVNEGTDIHYTVSIGVADYDGHSARSDDELITRADRALYAAKHQGKNTVSIAPPIDDV